MTLQELAREQLRIYEIELDNLPFVEFWNDAPYVCCTAPPGFKCDFCPFAEWLNWTEWKDCDCLVNAFLRDFFCGTVSDDDYAYENLWMAILQYLANGGQ